MSSLPIVSHNASKNDTEQKTVQPSSSRGTLLSRSNQNTFVHKLRALLTDSKHENLIYWNLDGRSFTVTNVEEFSKDVIPLHFKHNNFASFIRQLNMYGFHKLNRSPRGMRADGSVQTWEFSHPKFTRDFPDLMNEIRRSTSEPEISYKSPSLELDSSNTLSLLQSQQSEILCRVQNLTSELSQVKKELSESRRILSIQQKVIRKIISKQPSLFNGSLSPALSDPGQYMQSLNENYSYRSIQPTIFITPPDAQAQGSPQPVFHTQTFSDLTNSPQLGPEYQMLNNQFNGSNSYFTGSNQLCNENPQLSSNACNMLDISLNNTDMFSGNDALFGNMSDLHSESSFSNFNRENSSLSAGNAYDNNNFNLIQNMGNNANFSMDNDLSPTIDSAGNSFSNRNFQLQAPSGNRPLLTINTTNLRPTNYLSPRNSIGFCSDASGSDEEYMKVSPCSPTSPIQLQAISQTQLNASPVDSNNLSPNIFKPPPS